VILWGGDKNSRFTVIPDTREVFCRMERSTRLRSSSLPPLLAPTPGQAAGGALDDVMAAHIRKALLTTAGRINGRGGAAELLRINPNTLRGKIKKLGISGNWKP
jgi:DNA-binding NtrC family response regulator